MKTMGQQFREARERRKLTLSRAAALSRIKVQHLERMEADDFSQMPAPAYAKGFIRIYAELLELNPEPLVREYIDIHLEGNPREPAPAHEPPPPPDAPEAPTVDDGPASSGRKGWTPSLSFLHPRSLKAWMPHLVRGAAALAVLWLMLAGLNRCLGSGKARPAAAESGASDGLNPAWLIEEPPPPYLPAGGPEGRTP